MLHLFRKLRQSVLRTQSTQKYLLYAVGEIALVVIGILIALQINNWNQANKDSRYETQMLLEFKQDLAQDTTWANGRLTRISWINNALSKLAEMPERNDSLDHWLELGSNNIFMMVRTASYETIKSVGMNHIRHDALRRSLIDYYSYCNMQMDIITSVEGFEFEDWRSFIDRHFYIQRQSTLGGGGQGVLIPKDYDSLRNNPEYKQLLIKKLNSMDLRGLRIQGIKRRAIEVSKEIDEYLQEKR